MDLKEIAKKTYYITSNNIISYGSILKKLEPLMSQCFKLFLEA